MRSLLVAEQHSIANSNIRQIHKYNTEMCFDVYVMVLLYDCIMKWKGIDENTPCDLSI